MSVAVSAVAVSAIGVGLSAKAGHDAKKANSRALDNAAQADAAQQGVAMEQLEFAREQDARANVRNDRADALTEKVTGKQLESMDQNMALAADYDAYNKGTFRPLEKGIVADASAYDTPERREAAAGAAGAAVQQSLTQAHDADNRTLARMGVNPNSGRALATQNETSISGALAESAAENNARTQVETLGAAKKMDAASLGRNLPSAQATSAGLGINAGTAAINGTATTNNGVTSRTGMVGGLYGSAGGQFSNAATIAGNRVSQMPNIIANNNAISNANANAWTKVGGLAIDGAMALNGALPQFGKSGSMF